MASPTETAKWDMSSTSIPPEPKTGSEQANCKSTLKKTKSSPIASAEPKASDFKAANCANKFYQKDKPTKTISLIASEYATTPTFASTWPAKENLDSPQSISSTTENQLPSNCPQTAFLFSTSSITCSQST